MELATLAELFLHDCRDIYSAQSQALRELPRMRDAASTDALRNYIEESLRGVEEHLGRLVALFAALGESPEGKPCRAIEALLAADRVLIAKDADATVMDAALVGALSRLQHYKLSAYGCVQVMAATLGWGDALDVVRRGAEHEERGVRALDMLMQSLSARAPKA